MAWYLVKQRDYFTFILIVLVGFSYIHIRMREMYFNTVLNFTTSRDSSIGIATRLRAERSGF
jgi:hypothetical protein